MVNFMKICEYHFVVSLLSLAGLFLFGKTIAGQRWYALEALQYSPLNLLSSNLLSFRSS
jgi:rod shape determining protein RodA